MAIILSERAAALSITKIYKERLMQSAELVAKKELVSLSTAIDSAATKGQDSISFKLSTSVTKLEGAYKDKAIEVIEDDIRSAGYSAQRVKVNDVITGYEISWAEEESSDDNNGGEEPSGDPDEPAGPTVSDANSLKDAIDAADSATTIKLTEDMTLAESINIGEGKSLTLNLNGQTITSDTATAFTVDGGSLTIENGTISGTQRALEVSNGGTAVVNGGTFITTSEGQVMNAKSGGTLTVNGGDFTAQEAALMAFDGGTVIVNGGTYETADNFVFATNGKSGRGNNTLIINRATINANISSDNYEACGIYVANNDTVIVGPEVTMNIVNGCGLLMRGGDVTVKSGVQINIVSDKPEGFSGKVGDKEVKMSQSGIIYHESADYPGKSGMKLTVEDGVTINAVDHAIEILSNEETPNVTIGVGDYTPVYPEV